MQVQSVRQISEIVVRSYITNRLDISGQSSLVVSREAEEEGPFRGTIVRSLLLGLGVLIPGVQRVDRLDNDMAIGAAVSKR